jgi:transposase
MARVARGSEVVDGALQAIANAVTIEQLRQAQAVVLPLLFEMSLEQTAQITGLSASWVSKQRNRFIQGKPVGDGSVPARGGRHRQNFSLEEEAALLQPLLEQAKEGGILVVGQIRPQIEAALGRRMAQSSLYALLHRHNWRKLTPDKRHPQSDPIVQEAWKKNSPKISSKSAKAGKTGRSG